MGKQRMKALLVANPKGGSGKTTLATNLAGYLAGIGQQVALMDMDRQQSASAWLDLRDESMPPISRFQSGASPDWLVIDSPAGLHGKMLERALKLSTHVVVPVSPSLFDMAASRELEQWDYLIHWLNQEIAP
jgi:chromosome partitioning protein